MKPSQQSAARLKRILCGESIPGAEARLQMVDSLAYWHLSMRTGLRKQLRHQLAGLVEVVVDDGFGVDADGVRLDRHP